MKTWKQCDINHVAYRQYKRACSRKNVKLVQGDQFNITEVRYQTDGYSTVAVVTLTQIEWGYAAGGTPIIIHGYGVSVRAAGDRFNEHYGANLAINRAFEGAATVVKQRARVK